MSYEKIEVNLSGGLNLAAGPLDLADGDFARLDNAAFASGTEIQKRHGHVRLDVTDPTFHGGRTVSTTPMQWIYGWGYYDPSIPAGGTHLTNQVGPIKGVASRGDDLLVWNGFQGFSRDPGKDSWTKPGLCDTIVNGVAFPEPLLVCTAKERNVTGTTATVQKTDVAVGNLRTAYVWRESTVVYLTMEDNTTKSEVQRRMQIYSADPEYVQVKYSRNAAGAGFFFVTIGDDAATAIRCIVVPELNPGSFVQYTMSVAVAAPHPFDTKSIPDGVGILYEEGGTLKYFTLLSNGTTASHTLDISTVGIVASSPVSLAVHPDGTIGACWIWSNAGLNQVEVAFYNGSTFARLYAPVFLNNLAVLTTPHRVAMEFEYLRGSGYCANVAWTDATGTVSKLRRVDAAGTSGSILTLGDSMLTHQAIRVGNIVYFVFGYAKTNTLQPAFFVVSSDNYDFNSKPRGYTVASVLRGNATVSVSDKYVQSVSPVGDYNQTQATKWSFCALGSRLVLTATSTARKDFQVTRVDLDFMPKFRACQAGRSLYIAGGVVQEYDSEVVRPAGFLHWPEYTLAASAAGGALTASSTYTYRIYLVERNALGEWIRSTAITKTVALAVGDNRVVITLPPLPFLSRDRFKWEIYRSAANLSLLKLVTQVDPSSFGSTYLLSRSTSYTYNDIIADATIATNALDPAPALTQAGYGVLDQQPPPSCEMIANGRDRVWFAGGSIDPGSVAYTRLYDPGEAPLWNEALTVQVDRSSEEISGLGFMADSVAVFKPSRIYAVSGDGPDNLGRGDFDTPRLAITDTGCVSPDSIALIPWGIAFQSNKGIRIVTPGYGILNVGLPVDPAVSEDDPRIASVSRDVVRFQGASDTLSLCYREADKPRWSMWTYGAVSACLWKGNVIVAPSGMDSYRGIVWQESMSTFLDGGNFYSLYVDLGWEFPEKSGAWGKFRWWTLVGRYLSLHKLNGYVQYDFNEAPIYDFTWDPATPYASRDDSNLVADVATQDLTYNGAVIDNHWATPDETIWFNGLNYAFRKSFTRTRCGSIRLVLFDSQAQTVDYPGIDVAGAGWSFSGLMYTYRPETHNGALRRGFRNFK
jgi:hypothetical protein